MKDMKDALLNILNTIISTEMRKSKEQQDSSLVGFCLRSIRRIKQKKHDSKKIFFFSSSWRKLYPVIKTFVDHAVDDLFSGRPQVGDVGRIDGYMHLLAEIRRLGKMDKNAPPSTVRTRGPAVVRAAHGRRFIKTAGVAASLYLVICASLVFVAGAWQDVDSLKDFLSIPYNIWVEKDGVSIYKSNDVKTYNTLKELAEKENLDLLISDYYPPNITLNAASVVQIEQSKEIDLVSTDNRLRFFIEINAAKRIESFHLFYEHEKVIEINGVDVAVLAAGDMYQFDFVYKQDYYSVSFSDYDELTAVVASMTRYLR
ncbi:MAG: hypothetical protein LBS36_00605 [Oscillospiraceae bacterium]|jgi:hypothetical protein|nr:hypothetical protein [Oscillospiraceae bacterium]